MEHYALPRELRGNWIWRDRLREQVESYLFFRREFTLDGIPSSAELWLAARSFAHVFINGTHLSYGLGTCPVRGSYVWYYDIAYLLGTGVNTVTVLAHNTTVFRSSCHRQPSGLWSQLNIDEKPAVWTDRSWLLSEATCYAKNRPRRSLSGAFTERLDFRQYPSGWSRRNFSTNGWTPPDYCSPLDQKRWELVPFPGPQMRVEQQGFEQIAVQGACRKEHLSTNVCFAKFVDEGEPGVYAAETYFQLADDMPLEFELYADNPYRLFVNGRCIKEQEIRALSPGAVFHSGKSMCFRQGEFVDPPGTMQLQKGWNHIMFFQEVERGSSGMTLLFPDNDPNSLRLLRDCHSNAMPGWAIAGPLRTPLPSILGNLTLAEDTFYIPVDGRPIDEGAELMSYSFLPAMQESHPLADDEELKLRQGDFLTLALPRCVFGCPAFEIAGSDGDIIDAVSGTALADGHVLTWDHGQENVDTLILDGNEHEWMSCAPRGVRYLMLVVRKARETVRFAKVGVKVRRYDFDNPGRFECSDHVLDAIWVTGRRTLEATAQEAFFDSPCKDETQYIADAMIESWAAYSVFGNFGLSAKSLEEFAKVQFETGEMPAACPSDIYVNIPDYSLLWAVWLQRHYLYTGDKQLLDRLLPHLEKLFSYYHHVALPGGDVLGDLDHRFGAYSFLDHGQIDREGVSTGLNALYCRALLSGAWLFDAAGELQQAETLRDQAGRVAEQIRELTWDPERELFADAWHDGARSQSCTPQTNVLAIYGGVAAPDTYDQIFDALFLADAPYHRIPFGPGENPYFKYFILETAFALGRREWALDYMRWYWSGMLAQDARTWWELFSPSDSRRTAFTGSSCHGYGTSPNGFLIREVAGIRPATPGFATVYFNPLTNCVRSVKARIPTTYGHIMLEWEVKETGRLDAVIDATYPLSVIPELEPGVAQDAIIRVSDEVTIFATEEQQETFVPGD